MSETQGFPAKPHTQESMTSPAPAPRHFCGFSQTVAHKNFIVGMKKLLWRRERKKKIALRFDYRIHYTTFTFRVY